MLSLCSVVRHARKEKKKQYKILSLRFAIHTWGQQVVETVKGVAYGICTRYCLTLFYYDKYNLNHFSLSLHPHTYLYCSTPKNPYMQGHSPGDCFDDLTYFQKISVLVWTWRSSCHLCSKLKHCSVLVFLCTKEVYWMSKETCMLNLILLILHILYRILVVWETLPIHHGFMLV
jgi:hypothetical protein